MSSTVEFVVIEEDMAQLNDFACEFIKAAQSRVHQLDDQKRCGEGGMFSDFDGEWVDVSAKEVREGAAMQLDLWRDTSEFLARANCLILLACFTEKSLVWLCQRMGSSVPRPKGGQSKVAACVEYLKGHCRLNFDEPQESIEARDRCREVRNAFAHGEWDKCRDAVGSIDLSNAFAAVASLFYAIEKAHGATLTEVPDDRGVKPL